MNDRIESIRHPDDVVELQLARADKMNALDPAMFDALIAAGESLRNDRTVRAVADWNQPRCWSEPSRYRSAGLPKPRAASTASWVTPESNQTSRMSVTFS